MKTIVLILVLLLLLVGQAAAHADTYIDGTGMGITYGRDAQRIVSLAPAATEMLFYLGLEDRVVGRSSYCNYPPAATKLPSVGGFTDTSLEKIVALQPDLVVAYQGNNLELIGQLRKLRIPVVGFAEASSLGQIGDQMEAMFSIVSSPGTGTPAKLHGWELRATTLGGHPVKPENWPTVFYGMPGEVTYSAASGSFIDDLITRAGGRNVVPKGKERWPQVGAEFILAAQPDWLLVSTPCTGHTELSKASKDIRAQLANDPVWSKLKAVQQDHIVVINADVLLRPGPRILDALEQLEAALHGGEK
jgi:iron complex transport system substrate-binding protein